MQSVNNFKFKSIPLDLSSIAFDMAEGTLTEIKEIFFIEGRYAPIIRWCSFPQSDWSKPHQIICEFWRNNFTVDKMTLSNLSNDPQTLKVKPYLAIFSKKGDDYKYDYIGEKYAFFHNMSETASGTLLDQVENTQSAISLLDYTTLAATAIRGQCLISLYQGGTEERPELWNKLIMPITDSNGDAKKFVVCALRSPSN